ncbi:unnamed protein product [Bursaphelenchus okinawaensis]|uniref:Medium-chain acyl-CoA ligase ACSF2, mitochondrial n=1 Tax=Bursaphelenchus okinawaensis TaxID=465554 RepID=A0A811K159_9BILA|nr:unnamed protein product [Bursaphelenchus okinawaensis]CAG9089704.1 unnamed protein product [Bursaphelenchus okinawaensis]
MALKTSLPRYTKAANKLKQFAAVKSPVPDVETQYSYVHGATPAPLLNHTIGQRLRIGAETVPDKEICVFVENNIRKTYEEFHKEATQLAAGFCNLGLNRNDRIGIWGPNYYEWLLTKYAAALGGFCLVNINPGYQTEELRYALRKVGVSALITPPEFRKSKYYNTIYEIIPELTILPDGCGSVHSKNLPDLKHLIVFRNETNLRGAWNLKDVAEGGNGSNARKTQAEHENRVRFDDPANIQFTSGTTGHPKAATLTHHNIVNNAWFTGVRLEFDKGEHKICVPNPLYHCLGSVCGELSSVVHQQTAIFPAAWFNAQSTLNAINQEKVTSLFGTPTMFIDCLNHPDLKNTDVSSLYNGMVAGAPCPRDMMKRLSEEMNLTKLAIAYGSTEVSPMCLMVRAEEEAPKRWESVGTICEHVEVSITDAEGHVTPIGEPGEICVRGYSVMRGYWDDEEKTRKEITPDRWYHTGDIGIMEKDGSVKIAGRSKDLVIRGGENIYPAEVEQFLFTHDAIADVHVVGVPDVRFGEELCAWIRLKDGYEKFTEQELKDWCKGKIAHYKVPRYMLFKKETDFPMTVTGKVKKNILREVSRKELNLIPEAIHYNA